jgi:hypothetical protein
MADATITINSNVGRAASAPIRVIEATVDLTNITSYVTGGHLIAALTAAVSGLTFRSVPLPHYDGSETRYFTVNPSTLKVQAWDQAGAVTETTATDDLSGHTAVPVLLIGE